MTREEAIMANYSQKTKKIKTPFAKIIVEGNQEKSYFSILYFDKDFYVGYSSYCLDYVFNWLNEEFEIVEDENFIISSLRPVSRERVEKVFPGCPKCRYEDGKEPMEIYYPDGWDNGIGFEYGKAIFCPECGRPLTDEAVQMVMERLEELKNGSTPD